MGVNASTALGQDLHILKRGNEDVAERDHLERTRVNYHDANWR